LQVYNLPPPPADIIQQYEAVNNACPSVLLETAIVPRTVAHATELARAYAGEDRVGPANTHNNDPDAMLKRVLAGPDADEDAPNVEADNMPAGTCQWACAGSIGVRLCHL
jgi:hypothetical protein